MFVGFRLWRDCLVVNITFKYTEIFGLVLSGEGGFAERIFSRRGQVVGAQRPAVHHQEHCPSICACSAS